MEPEKQDRPAVGIQVVPARTKLRGAILAANPGKSPKEIVDAASKGEEFVLYKEFEEIAKGAQICPTSIYQILLPYEGKPESISSLNMLKYLEDTAKAAFGNP